jgi:biopolymer transport protein ExbD
VQAPPESGGGEENESFFAEINITPLTDVFLVLLIIFMVVASASVEVERAAAAEKGALPERAMEVQTPRGAGAMEIIRRDLLISVLPDGTIYVDSEPVAPADLGRVLREKRKAAPTAPRVVIRGDETAQYALIVKVLTAAENAGLHDLSLATRAE